MTVVTMIMGVLGLQKTVTTVTGKEQDEKECTDLSRTLPGFDSIPYHLFDLRGDEERIPKDLEEKMNALYRHDLYEKSKTAATSTEREKRGRPIWMRRAVKQMAEDDADCEEKFADLRQIAIENQGKIKCPVRGKIKDRTPEMAMKNAKAITGNM